MLVTKMDLSKVENWSWRQKNRKVITMDAHNFEKWFERILDKIQPRSVVVMNNAPYHSRQLENVPNMSWRKDAIQAWL
ncbi:hypothetical protein MSG28_001109 [Choristoneura fumiferana]|uniref:Uncharacterized protein n=1 Tax=Choristoneura fumiferana TaxID=7141 RepID=A0ACC0K3S4_CHOFU|nr:hypothetical protein MSG28_001109 [Choristoneura fumiferana]